MSRLAPTSTPRVGSSRMTTRGPGCSTFAMASFCWLPPESDLALAVDVAGVRMPKSEIACSNAFFCDALSSHGRAWRSRSHQRQVVVERETHMQPSPLAVLAEIWFTPWRAASFGSRNATRSPFR